MPSTSREKTQIIEDVLERLATEEAAATLVPLLLARPPAEDLVAFPPAALAVAAKSAASALSAHRPDTAFVEVSCPEGFSKDGEALQLVTIVNDDRPFLFDSVVAEIAESMAETHYISHPVLDVVRGGDGRILSFSASHLPDPADGTPARVSLIQLATTATDAEAQAELKERLTVILGEVAIANEDFYAMRERASRAAFTLGRRAERTVDPAERALVEEAARFLDWLADKNFIFLGIREFDYRRGEGGGVLERRPGSELGILRDPEVRVLRREAGEASIGEEVRAFLEAPTPLIVAKANTRSRVHRRVYMDYVGVKDFDASGRLVGETRIVGLFASTAYNQPILSVPYLRQKAQTVISRFGLSPQSHSAKALLNALETYSRDEVFQIDVDLLESFIGTILELGERPRVRILARFDPFDRFVSVLVFVPRERYDQRLREATGRLLAEAFDGHVSAYYPSFPEGPLARVHFIIGRRGGATPRPDIAALEARVADMARSWLDGFEKALAASGGTRALLDLGRALPGAYREAVAPEAALTETARIAALSPDAPLDVDFSSDPASAVEDGTLGLALRTLGPSLSLSTRVPILENMGFAVGSERTFALTRPDGEEVHVHHMDLTRRDGGAALTQGGAKALAETYLAVADGRIENDGFNALVLGAGLDWREANVLRALARYLRQTGLSLPDGFIAAVLGRHPDLARQLFELFAQSFDPARTRRPDEPEEGADAASREAARRGVASIHAAILEGLDAVDSLDDDRVIRRLAMAILAMLRTNYYSVPEISADPDSRPGAVKPALAFKFAPKAMDWLPQPVPFREIFVFDARVEGVHLRFGKVARGGLRWSDRSQDYRTEVLGLVKAQQVKNAVIVPVGAKGGFYPKRLPTGGDRDAIFSAGRSAYVVFVDSLLSVTDNALGDEVTTPRGVVAHDEQDPYLVVAADKGTATFSDTANAIAQAEDFWLDDAFASGGSAGYDHKGMGITARGAWEAVKRHFREMGRDGRPLDIQTETFTAAGCGDMSGDVFGNGMLLSQKTRLVAAFDHRDIFIDPDPDPAVSFAERKRLFELPRSSWQDYDRSLLSKGGGVFSRRDKTIRLSPEAAEAIGWDRRSGTPSEIINAILKSPVDLLWFGGIGTYIRASTETNADAGDRANDAVRVTGRELRAKVVGEGANLGATQKGRIEFARAGGRINTDAIDNSAGVNTSDVEVNIKIALKSAMAEGRLDRPARDRLLATMTDEVASLVLSNNYEQTLALSLDQATGVLGLAGQARLMSVLEERGELSREVETLPTDAGIADLKAAGKALTRPELAVLLAYAKLDFYDRILESSLPDEPYLTDRLVHYFPERMRQEHLADIETHRLRREIVATRLANVFVNRLGSPFAVMFADAAGATAPRCVAAYIIAADGFAIDDLSSRIDALDGRLDGETQIGLYLSVRRFLWATTAWFIRNVPEGAELSEAVGRITEASRLLRPHLVESSSDRARADFDARRSALTSAGVPEDLADDIALLPLMALLPDVLTVSRETEVALPKALSAFFGITRLFRIGRIEGALRQLRPSDYFEMLALERAAAQLSAARRRMTAEALRKGGDDPVAAWAEGQGEQLQRVVEQVGRLTGSGETSVARLTLAVGLLLDLDPR